MQDHTDNLDPLLSVADVAAILNIAPALLLRRHGTRGWPSGIKVGKAVRFSRAELRSYLEGSVEVR